MDSKDIGNLGEHIAIVQLLNNGITVSRPLGDSSKYDLILDINGALFTAQVKTTNSGNSEFVEFWLYTSSNRSKTRDTYYNVDLFLLVDLQNNKVFAYECSGTDKTVRFRYTGGNSASRNAEDHYLQAYLDRLPR